MRTKLKMWVVEGEVESKVPPSNFLIETKNYGIMFKDCNANIYKVKSFFLSNSLEKVENKFKKIISEIITPDSVHIIDICETTMSYSFE